MLSQNWKACDIFSPGGEGTLDIRSVATTRVRTEMMKTPWLKHYWDVEDVTQDLLRSAVRVAQLHPNSAWPDYVKLCQMAFRRTFINLRSRNRSEYFGYAVREADLPDGEFTRRVPNAREVILTGDEAETLRKKFVSDMKSSLAARATPERYDLAVRIMTSPERTFSEALSGLGVNNRDLGGAVRLLKRCVQGICPDLTLEDAYYMWSQST